MLFKVVKKGWAEDPKNPADFYLETNNLDDYGFKTSYELYVSAKHTENRKRSLIGSLRILKMGQRDGESNLIEPKVFEQLFL